VVTCYCSRVRPFHSDPKFIILIHRDEARRSIATGRMSHLCLENSRLFEGADFSEHEGVNEILQDPTYYCVVLYPASGSTNLSPLKREERQRLFPRNKRLVVFVIDGTWQQARRMKRLSQNLSVLPHISFEPPTPSAFHVRKQPRPGCYSTIEAIHQVIELLRPDEESHHQNLLEVFNFMVSQQVEFEVGHKLALHKL
jgi:DTW domain-containing protein